MDLQVTGRIKIIMDTMTFESGFSKRQFVVTTNEEYPQDICMEFYKDKTSVLDSYNVGDLVDVGFNLRGSEYNGRYFVNLQAWKIGNVEASDELPPLANQEHRGDMGDLPF